MINGYINFIWLFFSGQSSQSFAIHLLIQIYFELFCIKANISSVWIFILTQYFFPLKQKKASFCNGMIIYYGDFKKYSECSCLENVFFVRFLIYFICHLSRQVQFACLVSKPVYWKMKKGIITHSNKQTTKMFATNFSYTLYMCMNARMNGKAIKRKKQQKCKSAQKILQQWKMSWFFKIHKK